jgi:ribosomal protein S18 acetylase RimI-like enzyme
MIENVSAEDIERVIVLRDSFCKEDAYILQRTALEFRVMYGEKISNGQAFLRLLTENGNATGYCLVELQGQTGWIKEVYVDPLRRDVQAYLTLLQDAVAWCTESQALQVRYICPERPLECTAAFCEFGFDLMREHVQMEMPLQEIFDQPPALDLISFKDFGPGDRLVDWVAHCTGNDGLYSATDLEPFVLDEGDFSFVAFKDGEPVGFMIAEVNEQRNQQERQRVLYIEQMAVAPGYRMRGLATQMLDLVFRKGLALGLLTARLHVFHDNAAAYRLYEKLGFVEVKRINHWLLEVE